MDSHRAGAGTEAGPAGEGRSRPWTIKGSRIRMAGASFQFHDPPKRRKSHGRKQ